MFEGKEVAPSTKRERERSYSHKRLRQIMNLFPFKLVTSISHVQPTELESELAAQVDPPGWAGFSEHYSRFQPHQEQFYKVCTCICVCVHVSKCSNVE